MKQMIVRSRPKQRVIKHREWIELQVREFLSSEITAEQLHAFVLASLPDADESLAPADANLLFDLNLALTDFSNQNISHAALAESLQDYLGNVRFVQVSSPSDIREDFSVDLLHFGQQ